MSRGIVGLLLWIATSLVLVSANAAPQINLGNIPAGKTVTISYDVTVNNNATGNEVSSQATVTGDNFADVLSDDPSTATLNDATTTDIDAATTSLALGVSDSSPTSSENVTFTATVSTDSTLPVPAGDVEFRVNGGSATVVALDAGGVATFDTAFSVGSYTVTADYLGNAESAPSNDSATINAIPADTTTTIETISPSTIYPGDVVTVNFNVTIEPVAAGLPLLGTVTVSDGTDNCSADVAVGSCDIQFAEPGTKDLVAKFTSGSPELNGSVSAMTAIEVVNNPPLLTAISDQTVFVDNELTFDAEASDPDPNATIAYSLDVGAPAGASINPSTGVFSWTPTATQGGTVYAITIVAEDQFGASDSEQVAVTVKEKAITGLTLVAGNNAPVSSENVTFTATVSTDSTLPVPAGDVEFRVDGGSATVVALDAGGVATFDTAFSVGSYTVTADYVGNAESAPSNDSATINVIPADTTTTIETISPSTIYPGDVVTVNFNVTIEPVAAGLPLSGTVTVSDGTDNCSADVAVGSCDIQFAEPETKDLVATFTSGSPEFNGSVSSATSIEVINNPPVLSDIDDQTVVAETALVFDVEATDPDSGASITYSLGSDAPAGAGIDAATGEFSWTPTAAQGGDSYSITIVAEDQFNASDSKQVTVTVLEAGAPMVNDDVVMVDEDEAITFDPFVNDESAEGFDFSTMVLISAPASGILEIDRQTGQMTYRGAEDFNGFDQAQYQVQDTQGTESNIATIEITVNPVNDAPVIESEPESSVVEMTSYVYIIEASDVEGQALQFAAPTLPVWLQLVGNELTGTPQASDLGVYPVTVTVSDGADVTEQSFDIMVVSANSNDVTVSQEADTVAPLVGEDFSITYTVGNSGPAMASNVELSAILTGDAVLNSIDPRCQVSGLQLNCSLGGLEASQSEAIELVVNGLTLGDVYSFAEVTSPDDEVTTNNQSGLGVSITNDTMSDKAATVGEAESRLALTGDVDNDGKEDIVLLEGFNSIGSVFVNEGTHTFSKSSDILGNETPMAAQLVHVNDDDVLDLVIATGSGESTLVYLGSSNGIFTISQTLSTAASHALDTGDINGDGTNDLLIANEGANEVYLNQDGHLQLSHQLGNENSLAAKLVDIDGDGLLDAVISHDDGTSFVYTNTQLLSNAGYTIVDTGLVKDINSIDVDNNGTQELVFALAIDGDDPATIPQNKLYQWNGGLELMQAFGAVDSQQVMVADIDGDDDQDLFVLNSSGAHQIYLNDAGVLVISNKLLLNQESNFAAWLLNDNEAYDLLLAESLEEGSALYANQGDGNFGVAETDLALNYTANVSTVTEDGVIEAQLIVTNNGPGSAQGVELSASISSQLNVIRFGSGTEMCNVSDTAMSCDLGNMVPGDRITIPLRLLAMNTGEAMIKADVMSSIDDLNPANNSQQVTIEVTPRRDSGGGQMGYLLLLMLALVAWRRKVKAT